MTPTLEERRLNAGLSHEELAKEIGVSHPTLRRVEQTGNRPIPKVAKKIADYYGVKVTDLWPVDERKAAA